MAARKTYTPLWDYFEKPTDGTKLATCNYCTRRLSYKTTITNLKVHLKQKHPYVYEMFLNSDGLQRPSPEPREFEIEGLDQEQDALQNDDSNQFTEVIYVEEKRNKSPKHGYLTTKAPKSVMSQDNAPRKKHKRRNSDASDEKPLRDCSSAPDQLDSFLLYIKSLLLKTSPELSMKLQMEILNVVMRAKLNETQNNSSFELSYSGGKSADEPDKVVVTETAGASAGGDA